MDKFGKKIPAHTGLQVFRLQKLKFTLEVGLADRTHDCANACLSLPASQCRGFSYRSTAGDCHLFATPYVKGMLKKSFGATSYYDRTNYCVDDNGVSTDLPKHTVTTTSTPARVCNSDVNTILTYASLLGTETTARMQPATFGPDAWQKFENLNVWLAMPSDGCNPMPPVSGGVLIVERGGCSFWEKVVNGQRAGAHSVIIVNNDGGSVLNAMSCDEDVDVGCRKIAIPSFYMHRTDWFEFKAVLQSSISPSGVGIGCGTITTSTTPTATTTVRPTTILYEDNVCSVYVAWGSCKSTASLRPFMELWCAGACYPIPMMSREMDEDGDEREENDSFAVTTTFDDASDEFLSFVNPPQRVSVLSDVIVVRIQYKTMYDTLKLHLAFLTPQPDRRVFAKYTVRMREHIAEEEPEARFAEGAESTQEAVAVAEKEQPVVVTREPYSSIVEIELKLKTQLMVRDDYQLEVSTWSSGPRVTADILSSMTATGIAAFTPKSVSSENDKVPCAGENNSLVMSSGHLEECDEDNDQCCRGLVCTSSHDTFVMPVCVVPDKGFGECYAAAEKCTFSDQCCSLHCSSKTNTCDGETDDATIIPPPRVFKDPLDPPAGTCYTSGARCSRDYQCCDKKGCDADHFQCRPVRPIISVGMSREAIEMAYGDHSNEYRLLYEGTTCLTGSTDCIPSRIATARLDSSVLFDLGSAEGLAAARAKCQKHCSDDDRCKGVYLFSNKKAETKCFALRELGEHMPDGSYPAKLSAYQDYSYVKIAAIAGEVPRTTKASDSKPTLPTGAEVLQTLTLRFRYKLENITTSQWIELASNLVGGMLNDGMISEGEVSHVMRYGDFAAPQTVEPASIVVAFSPLARVGLADDAARLIRAKMWSAEGFSVTFDSKSIPAKGAQSGTIITINGTPLADTVSGVTFPPQITFPKLETTIPSYINQGPTTKLVLSYIIPTDKGQKILDPQASGSDLQEIPVKTDWVVVIIAIVGIVGLAIAVVVLKSRRRTLLLQQVVDYSQAGSESKSQHPVYESGSLSLTPNLRTNPFDMDWDMYDQSQSQLSSDVEYSEPIPEMPFGYSHVRIRPPPNRMLTNHDVVVDATLRALTSNSNTDSHSRGTLLSDFDAEAGTKVMNPMKIRQHSHSTQHTRFTQAETDADMMPTHDYVETNVQGDSFDHCDNKSTQNIAVMGGDGTAASPFKSVTFKATGVNDVDKQADLALPTPPPRSNAPPPLPPPNRSDETVNGTQLEPAIPVAIQHFMQFNKL